MTADKTDILRSGLTPMSFRTEFPDYPADQMPTIPEGFADCSWHNDGCPYFWNEEKRLGLFVDYPDPSDRETPETSRFMLLRTDSDGGPGAMVEDSDDWDAITAAIAGATA